MREIINQQQAAILHKSTGQMVGLGDYRPRFGRFEVVQ